MADQLINSFPTGSISDNSLGVIGDPSTGNLINELSRNERLFPAGSKH